MPSLQYCYDKLNTPDSVREHMKELAKGYKAEGEKNIDKIKLDSVNVAIKDFTTKIETISAQIDEANKAEAKKVSDEAAKVKAIAKAKVDAAAKKEADAIAKKKADKEAAIAKALAKGPRQKELLSRPKGGNYTKKPSAVRAAKRLAEKDKTSTYKAVEASDGKGFQIEKTLKADAWKEVMIATDVEGKKIDVPAGELRDLIQDEIDKTNKFLECVSK